MAVFNKYFGIYIIYGLNGWSLKNRNLKTIRLEEIVRFSNKYVGIISYTVFHKVQTPK